MNKVVKNILLLAVALVLASASANYFDVIYNDIFYIPPGFSSFSVPSSVSNFINGFPLAYIFFIALIFTIFGDKNKYIWFAVLILPVALFEIYFERLHIYFPILIGLVGWGLGAGLNWVITRKFAKAPKF